MQSLISGAEFLGVLTRLSRSKSRRRNQTNSQGSGPSCILGTRLYVSFAKIDLLGAAIEFVRARGQQDHVSGPRDLPSRMKRLIDMGDHRRTPDYRGYLDDDFWDGETDTPDSVSGLIVVRDLRK